MSGTFSMTLSRRVSLVEAMQHTSAMVLAPLTKVIRRLALLVWMKVTLLGIRYSSIYDLVYYELREQSSSNRLCGQLSA